MKKIVVGALTGATVAVCSVALTAYTLKKNVIEPIEEKENKLKEHQKRAARKNYARSY